MSDIDDIINRGEAEKRHQHEHAMNALREAPMKAQLLTSRVHAEIVAALKELLPEDPGPLTDLASDGSVKSFIMKRGDFSVQFRIKTLYQPGAQPDITARAFYKGNREDLHASYSADGDYSSLIEQVKNAAARLSRA